MYLLCFLLLISKWKSSDKSHLFETRPMRRSSRYFAAIEYAFLRPTGSSPRDQYWGNYIYTPSVCLTWFMEFLPPPQPFVFSTCRFVSEMFSFVRFSFRCLNMEFLRFVIVLWTRACRKNSTVSNFESDFRWRKPSVACFIGEIEIRLEKSVWSLVVL